MPKVKMDQTSVEEYDMAISRDAAYSNAFNLSFGTLSVIENKTFDFIISQINIDYLEDNKNDYIIKNSLLLKMLSKGDFQRGVSGKNLLKILRHIQSLNFCVPDYETDRIRIDSYFSTFFVDKEKIEFSFTKSAFPYIRRYRDLGFGAFMIPFRILDRISSKKAYLILKAVSGKLHGNKIAVADLSPQVWNTAFNGEYGKEESVKQITRDIKRGVDALNKNLSDVLKVNYFIKKDGRKISSIAVKLTLLTDDIHSIDQSSKTQSINLEKYDQCLPKEFVDNRKSAKNGKFKVIKDNEKDLKKNNKNRSKRLNKKRFLDSSECI